MASLKLAPFHHMRRSNLWDSDDLWRIMDGIVDLTSRNLCASTKRPRV